MIDIWKSLIKTGQVWECMNDTNHFSRGAYLLIMHDQFEIGISDQYQVEVRCSLWESSDKYPVYVDDILNDYKLLNDDESIEIKLAYF